MPLFSLALMASEAFGHSDVKLWDEVLITKVVEDELGKIGNSEVGLISYKS
jgi:hypothetical protein